MVVVEGKIKGKARPRVYNGRAITPKDTVTYENWIKTSYINQCGKYFEGPIRGRIEIYYQIPKSCTKKRLQDIRDERDYPCKKPDCDNVAKIVLDSLNEIAYHDDSQIIELTVIKRWTEEKERIEFELEEMVV